MSEPLLRVEALEAGYGEVQVLWGISLGAQAGQLTTIVGANGVGKTTLLKLLLGEIPPDAGQVRLGSNLVPAHFDQRRSPLAENATLWQTLAPGGGDSIMVRGQQKHVVGYLREFLFDERQALMPVSRLSGGERARLLLARLFAQPSNLLVMDEPTNDLDLDTLDLLEDVLAEYDGTILLVSHDRDFLDRVVTSVIVMAGDGRAVEHAGGYSDLPKKETRRPAPAKAPARQARRRSPARLGFNEQRELDRLPGQIEQLLSTIAILESELADPATYRGGRFTYDDRANRLAEAKRSLAAAEERWLELEGKRESLGRKESAS